MGKNLPKNREKSADFPGIRNSASRVANALDMLEVPGPIFYDWLFIFTILMVTLIHKSKQ